MMYAASKSFFDPGQFPLSQHCANIIRRRKALLKTEPSAIGRGSRGLDVEQHGRARAGSHARGYAG